MPTDREVTATPHGDEGMSLLEVLMAIVVIGTVMAAAAPFMVTSVATSDRQRRDQAAIQIANDGLERARALSVTALTTGRGQVAAQQQWDAAPAEVKTLLDQMQMVADVHAPATDGEKAALPTKAVTVTINKTTYSEQWYVGLCWQNKVDATPVPASTAAPQTTPCGKTVTGVKFYRVVVSVQWPHPACPARPCVYTASTLISYADDPTFDTNQPPPNVTQPTDKLVYTGDAVGIQITSTGGRLPLKWAATGLPAELTIDADAGLIKGTAATIGTYTVTVKATDMDNRADDAQFKLTVVKDLVLTQPANQSTPPNTTVSLAMTATGGVTPLTWSATNLPTGLTINSSTGVISGKTAAATGSFTPTITVKDSGAPRSRTVTFTWSVVLPLTMDSYTPPPVVKGTSVDYQLAGLTHGGTPPYRWSVVNVPDGLVLDPATGRVTGNLQYATQFITTAIVTDSTGAQAQTDITVAVTASGNDMRVTAPTGTSRTNATGTTITTVQATAGGSNPPSHTWTALNLPPGLVISAGGAITGKPTKAGTYRVTLTVTNNKNDLARMMFDWKIT